MLVKSKWGVLVAVLACAVVAGAAQSPRDKAWDILKNGAAEHSTEGRAMAIRVLGLVPNDRRALGMALTALGDEKAEVRAAAADALGQMHAKSALPKLRAALDDKDNSVVLAAASALKEMHDPEAYRVYYEVLTGQLKSGGSLIGDQTKMLHDPKKMAEYGFEQGIGQIPFAGMGYRAIRALTKDDSSPVRAAAAKVLANDPDPRSGKALVHAAFDNSWTVRMAALEAIAKRDDPSALRTIQYALDDGQDEVRFTAAAAVVRLSEVRKQK